MKQIEKIAARMPAAKHLAALYGRAIKGEKVVPRFYIMGKKVEKTLRVPLSRKKELAKALRATKREVKKTIRGKGPELAGIALGLPAGAGISYGIGKARKKKEK